MKRLSLIHIFKAEGVAANIEGFFLRLAQSALPGLTDLLDAGLYSKLKGALSIGGKASYFTCDQPPVSYTHLDVYKRQPKRPPRQTSAAKHG